MNNSDFIEIRQSLEILPTISRHCYLWIVFEIIKAIEKIPSNNTILVSAYIPKYDENKRIYQLDKN